MTNDVQYEVGVGFNLPQGKKRPTKFKPATLLAIDDGTYELRYDSGLRVKQSELPKSLPDDTLAWLTGERGCLVVVIDVKDESPSEPEDISVAPEEVEDGEVIS